MREESPTRDSVRIHGRTVDEWNDREVEAPDYPDESMYLQECSMCGQLFDGRYFGDMLYHSILPDHEPLQGISKVRLVPVD